MANRIRGSVIIVDATGNVNFPGSGTQGQIASIAFWANDSTGALSLAFQATTDTIIKMASPVNQPNTTTLRFVEGTYFQSLSVQTITAGTAFIYLR